MEAGRPEWWGWEAELSPHLLRRMLDREFTEVELWAMLDGAIDPSLDVDQINLGSVSLSRSGFDLDVVVYPIQLNFADTGTPFEGVPCDCHDLTGDGEMDLDLKFDKQEVVEAFGLRDEEDGAFVELKINGLVKGEIEFVARDCIRIINH